MADMPLCTALQITFYIPVLYAVPVSQDVCLAGGKPFQFRLSVVVGLYGIEISLYPVFHASVDIFLVASLLMYMVLSGLNVKESNLALFLLKIRPVCVLHRCSVYQILDGSSASDADVVIALFHLLVGDLLGFCQHVRLKSGVHSRMRFQSQQIIGQVPEGPAFPVPVVGPPIVDVP